MRLVTLFHGLAFVCLAQILPAQTVPPPQGTNATIRPLSRVECIALALEHNLNIRIARHDPRISYYNLRGAQGYWEPTFNMSARQEFNKNESYKDASNVEVPGKRGFKNDVALSTVNVRSPFGSEFSINAFATHQYGMQGQVLQNPFNPTGPGLIVPDPYDQFTSGASVGYRQNLLRDFWIDADRLRVQLNQREVKVSEFALQNQVMNVVSSTEKSYYDLISTIESVGVAEISLELNEQLLAETKQRVRVGVAVPLDEKQVESEVANARASLIQARLNRALAENELKRLLTSDYSTWYNIHPVPTEKLVAIPETYNLNDSWLMGISLRPDYNQAKLRVEMDGLQVKYDKNQLYPTLQFVTGYGRSGVNQDGSFTDTLGDIKLERNANYYFGGQFSYPLGNSSARNTLKADKERMEQTKDQLRLLHLNILVEIENAVNAARSAFEKVGATREARIFAEAALSAEQKKLENGKSTSYFVLDFQRQVTERRYEEIDALRQYNKALSNLYLFEGSTLQRNRIDVEYK